MSDESQRCQKFGMCRWSFPFITSSWLKSSQKKVMSYFDVDHRTHMAERGGQADLGEVVAQQTKLWLIYTQGPGVKIYRMTHLHRLQGTHWTSAWDCRQTIQHYRSSLIFFGVFSWAAVHQNGSWDEPFCDSKQRSCQLEASDVRWYETVSVYQHYVWAPSVTRVQSLLEHRSIVGSTSRQLLHAERKARKSIFISTTTHGVFHVTTIGMTPSIKWDHCTRQYEWTVWTSFVPDGTFRWRRLWLPSLGGCISNNI